MNLAIQHQFEVPEKDSTIGEYIFLYESNAFPGEFDAFITPDHQFANIRFDLKDCQGSTIQRVVSLTKQWIKNYHRSHLLSFDMQVV